MWLQWIFSVACLTVGACYATSLISRGGWPRHSAVSSASAGRNLSHLLMAWGMAAMFSPIGIPVPRLVWVAGFGLCAAWFAASALREGPAHPGWGADSTAHHLVANLAMLFMLMSPGHGVAAGGGAGGPGHEGHSAATAAGIAEAVGTGPVGTGLVVALAGYFTWQALRALRGMFGTASVAQPEPTGSGSVAVLATLSATATTRLAATGHLVMGTAMAVMFGLML